MFESSLQQIIEKELLDMQRYNFKMENKKRNISKMKALTLLSKGKDRQHRCATA